MKTSTQRIEHAKCKCGLYLYQHSFDRRGSVVCNGPMSKPAIERAARLASTIREAAARAHMSDHCDTCNTVAPIGRSAYLPIGVTCDVCEVSHALYAHSFSSKAS